MPRNKSAELSILVKSLGKKTASENFWEALSLIQADASGGIEF